MNTTNRYHYELPPRGTVLVISLYLGLSALMAHLARSNVELHHVGFAMLSVIFATLALLVLMRRIAFPCTLELTDDAILLPRGLPWPRITTIPYADIISIRDCGDSLSISTVSGCFMIGTVRFEGYPAVREMISVKTQIPLEPLHAKDIGPKLDRDELPKPLLQWTEPEDWPRFRTRVEISKPVLNQFRTELWFFVRCYAFCCVFIVVPCLGIVLLTWLYVSAPFQLVAVFTFDLLAICALAIFITMIHWLYGISPVGPETKISFRDRGISKRLLNGQQFDCSYRQFCGWAVIERQFDGHILQILLMRRVEKGGACNQAFALPDAIVRDQVVQILNDRQLPHIPNLKPTWEC